MSKITLSQFIKYSLTLPGCIKSHSSPEECEREIVEIFSSQKAKEVSNVLYAFVCEKEIPRVKSKSKIIYIGKTKQSLSRRYLKYAKTLCEGSNWEFYKYVISQYGPIRIAFLSVEKDKCLKEAETELLADYYEKHKEYPPKNSQRR